MDNFVYEEEILLDEDGVPVEIYADEPEETTRVWQTADTETQGTTAEQMMYFTAEKVEKLISMEVNRDEFTQTEELSVQKETEVAVTAVPEVSEEPEAEGTETAVSSVPSETGVSETATEVTTPESVTSAVTSEIAVVPEAPAETPNQSNSIMAFLLLAGVFGAAVAAAVFYMKNSKKKLADPNDISQLSAKERDSLRLNRQKKKKPKKKRVSKKRIVPKTTQKTLPYKRVCDEYIIKIDDNKFSKTYRFEDVNYAIAKQEEQEAIFLAYCSVLNSFDTSADIQITVHNNRVNKADFNKMVLLKHKGDSFDHYIDVYNEMLVEKMEQGQNGIIRNKYLTVTVQAADLESARAKFASIDLEVINAFKKIGSIITPLTSHERMSILKDIFRGVDEEIPVLSNKDFSRQAERAYCCPDYFEFKKDYFMWNNKYARTMFIKDMPASLKDNILTDIANTNLDVMVSVNVAPVDPYKALKIVNHQLTSMRANKLQAEKKAIQSGYTSDVINEDLKHSLIEAEELLDDLRSKNQKMFLDNIIIMVTADDFDELENNTETIEAVVRKHICSVSTLKFQQEKGLQSVLPLGNCTLKIRRTLTTESTAVFLPFASKEITHKNGMYYGLNTLSNNMIIFNRLMLKNPNGFILGSPGSGKSFSAKREMLNVFLATDDDIIISDPESEYSPLVARFGGQVIKISPISDQYINPMDINMNYSDDDNPIALKADFILSLCELIVGGKNGLEPVEKTIIDRCVRLVYQEYLADPVPEKMPILEDLYNLLRKQEEPEAQRLATSLEIYVTGSLNVFNHQKNVDINNRIVCFDIKELGKQLKKIGMLVIQDQVWNRVTMNRSAHKSTRYYVDEFHLLLKEEQTAAYSVEIWKRFRKWGGIPTGITQNIKDLLSSREIENIFENSDFIYMLNQASGDRQILAKQLNISPTQLSYVTNSNEGEGLLFYGNVIIPFVDRFPKNSLYKIMTTRLEETSEQG